MKLLLDSLRLENYRVFRDLRIERLGRANLVVGKNNTGKSSILEAVRLFATRASVDAISSILESHDETPAGDQPEDRLFALKQLFHGRDAAWDAGSEIRIGEVDDVLSGLSLELHEPENGSAVLVITFDGMRHGIPLDGWQRPSRSTDAVARQAYVSPHGVTAEAAGRLWDLIALTDLEEDVISALRIISPDIERISFIGEGARKRVPVAKLKSQERPVPLRSLGDGVNRMLGIVLSLISARGGVLLVDEVENGIHFSAQQQLWELIFRTAHRLNAQVFATTHSWDCIQAFQHAASEDAHEEAVLIRLDARRDSILPTTFSEHDLSIVTREQIEVR